MIRYCPWLIQVNQRKSSSTPNGKYTFDAQNRNRVENMKRSCKRPLRLGLGQ